jgi:hypothetical protein
MPVDARWSWFKVVPLWMAIMSGTLSIFREAYGIFTGHPIDPKSIFWACARIAFVLSAAAAWVQEHRARVDEREKNEKPELVGGITGVSKSPVTEVRCHVQLDVWIRNNRNVETGVRVRVTINDIEGKPLFIPHLHDRSLALSLQTERLGYGRRIAGFLPFDVEAPMSNVDGTTARVSLVDDFDQVTVLKFSELA